MLKKNNGNKLTPIDIDNELSPEANIKEKHNILEANQLLGSNNMKITVNNLRIIAPPNFYIATLYALTYANMLSIEWQHLLIFCSSHTIPEYENGIFLFPTFTGNTDCGHWHLAIIKNLEVYNMDI